MPDEYADAENENEDVETFSLPEADDEPTTGAPAVDDGDVEPDDEAEPALDPEDVDEEANGSAVLHAELQDLLDKGYKHSQLVVKTHADGSFKSVEIAKNA